MKILPFTLVKSKLFPLKKMTIFQPMSLTKTSLSTFSLQKKLIEADSRITCLKEENQSLSRHLRSLADTKTLSSLAIPHNDPQIVVLKREIDQLKTEQVLLKDRHVMLAKKHACAEERNLKFEKYVEELEIINQQQTDKINELTFCELDCQSLSSRVAEKDVMINELRSELDMKDNEVISFKARYAELEANLINREEEYKRIIGKLRSQLNSTPKEESARADLESENQRLLMKISDLNEKNSNLAKIVSNQQAVTTRLEQKLESAAKEKNDLNSELTERINSLQKELANLKQIQVSNQSVTLEQPPIVDQPIVIEDSSFKPRLKLSLCLGSGINFPETSVQCVVVVGGNIVLVSDFVDGPSPSFNITSVTWYDVSEQSNLIESSCVFLILKRVKLNQ
ncbi:hypothetical protein GEMRC1_013639 [Eukaryota sp. GEM-RC1]